MASHTENVAAYRDVLIGNAVAARKIAPDRADDYRRMFSADPRGVAHLLTAPPEEGGLMAGIAGPLPQHEDSYPRHWLAGSRPSGAVAFEDAQTAAEGAGGAVPPRQDGEAPAPSARVTVEP